MQCEKGYFNKTCVRKMNQKRGMWLMVIFCQLKDLITIDFSIIIYMIFPGMGLRLRVVITVTTTDRNVFVST